MGLKDNMRGYGNLKIVLIYIYLLNILAYKYCPSIINTRANIIRILYF